MLFNRVTVAGLVVSLFVTASVAAAATLDKGATELAGSAGVTSTSFSGGGTSTTVVTADVKYGFCVSRNWEIAPQVILTSLSGGGSTLTNFSGAVSGIYNFATAGNNLVPFLEAGVGLGSVSAGGSSQSFSTLPLLAGGIRMLMGNSASINITAGYQRVSMSSGGSTATENTIGVQAGLSIFPRGFGGK